MNQSGVVNFRHLFAIDFWINFINAWRHTFCSFSPFGFMEMCLRPRIWYILQAVLLPNWSGFCCWWLSVRSQVGSKYCSNIWYFYQFLSILSPVPERRKWRLLDYTCGFAVYPSQVLLHVFWDSCWIYTHFGLLCSFYETALLLVNSPLYPLWYSLLWNSVLILILPLQPSFLSFDAYLSKLSS